MLTLNVCPSSASYCVQLLPDNIITKKADHFRLNWSHIGPL